VARYDGSAAIVFIDLDHFKSINDQFGHLAGDATLQVVSDTIVRSCRNSDVVARFGGDEFAVLFWNLSEEDAHAKARTLEKRIDELRLRLAADCVSVGASAGVTMLDGSDSPDQIIRRADADMYSRKTAKGRAPRHEPALRAVP
jgi:diguanylate cyclase (GGDEF)-like protein